MGVGFGLMVLIGVAGGSHERGIGVGGFFVIMGLAFFINSLFDHPRDELSGHSTSARLAVPGPAPAPEPPRRD